LQIEVRYAEGDEAALRKMQRKLVALPGRLVVGGRRPPAEVVRKSPTPFPIVFVTIPTGGVLLRRAPATAGRQSHGFMMFEYNLCGKWWKLLKEKRGGLRKT